MNHWVQVSLKKFSHVAAYLELAKEQEHAPYRQLFEDAERDVYWVLCKLHQIIANMRKLSENTLSGEEAIKPDMRLDDHAHLRHERDFLTLRDYNRYLELFIVEIAAMRQSV